MYEVCSSHTANWRHTQRQEKNALNSRYRQTTWAYSQYCCCIVRAGPRVIAGPGVTQQGAEKDPVVSSYFLRHKQFEIIKILSKNI